MIVIKLEMHSDITGQVREIGRAVIWNDASGTEELGNYQVSVCREGCTNYDRPARRGRVYQYPRNIKTPWRLVIRALKSAFPEEE